MILFVISSKVGYILIPQSKGEISQTPFVDVPPLTTTFDFPEMQLLRSIDASLSRLNIDRLDMVFIHDPDESKSIEPGWLPGDVGFYNEVMAGAYPTLVKLREEGVIKAIGLGMNQWQMLTDFARDGDFDCFIACWPVYTFRTGITKRIVTVVQRTRYSNNSWGAV